jgi:hypothetical protein
VADRLTRARSELALRIGLGRPKQPARPSKRAAPERAQAKPAQAKRAKRIAVAAE